MPFARRCLAGRTPHALAGLSAAPGAGRRRWAFIWRVIATVLVVAAAPSLAPGDPQRELAQADGADAPLSGKKAERAWPQNLRVRVVDDAGSALAGISAMVKVGEIEVRHETGVEGEFPLALPAAPPDLLQISVDHEPFVAVRARWQPQLGAAEYPADDVVLRLERGRTVGGKIVDEQQRPVANAAIRLNVTLLTAALGERLRPAQTQLTTTSAADGTWSIARLPQEVMRGALQVNHPGFVFEPGLSGVSGESLKRIYDSRYEHVLRVGMTLSGRITDSDGQPVAGAVLTIGRSHPDKPQTDADGRYRFEHCRTGETTIVAVKPGVGVQTRTVAVKEQAENAFDLQLRPAQTTHVRVIDKAGQPIEGATVVPIDFSPPHSFALTDSSGNWIWNFAPPEPVQYAIYKVGFMQSGEFSRLAPQAEAYTVTLGPQLRVSGTVVDDATGQPVESFRARLGVVYRVGSPIDFQSGGRSATGRGGQYSLVEQIARPGFMVRVEADGYLPADSRAIQSDEGTIAIDFRLKRGSSPSGIVLGSDGMPEAGAAVYLGTTASRPQLQNGTPVLDGGSTVRTAADGRFRFSPQTEDFGVYVFGASGFAQARHADFEKSGGEPLKMTLKPWARVEGVVRNRAGRLADQEIRLHFMGEGAGRSWFGSFISFSDYTARSDAEGRFAFERIPPETEALVTHMVRATPGSPIRSGHSARVKLAPGQQRSLILGLPGRAVTGNMQLVGADFELDWTKQSVWLRLENDSSERDVTYGPPQNSVIAADGSFRIEEVPPGRYVIAADATRQIGTDSRNSQFVGRAETTLTVPELAADNAEVPISVGMLTIRSQISAAPTPPLLAAVPSAGRSNAAGGSKALRRDIRIVDRAGRPVAGAKVTAWYGLNNVQRVVRKTDTEGKVAFENLPAHGAWVFVEADRFRFDGTYSAGDSPAAQLVITRSDEPAGTPALATLSALKPGAEALARSIDAMRQLAAVAMQGPTQNKMNAIGFLTQVDPLHAVETLAANPIDLNDLGREYVYVAKSYDRTVQSLAARSLARTDPARTRALLEKIASPGDRGVSLAQSAASIPAAQAPVALEWLREARRLAREPADTVVVSERLAVIAKNLLQFGDKATALEVLREAAAEARKPDDSERADFGRCLTAWLLAPFDLEAALALVPYPLVIEPTDEAQRAELSQRIARTTDPALKARLRRERSSEHDHDRCYGNIAHQIAAENPAEAERILGAVLSSRVEYAVRVCSRMAAVDFDRARRIADGIRDPMARANALGVIADALTEKDKARAQALLRESFALLTAQADAGLPVVETWRRTPLRVAVGLLAAVERIDPALVREYLWHTLSLRGSMTLSPAYGQHVPPLGKISPEAPLRLADPVLAILVARYDPSLARLLALAPGDGTLDGGFKEVPYYLLGAMAVIDPQAAIEATIAMPQQTDPEIDEKFQAWMQVSAMLPLSNEERWNLLLDETLRIWRPGKLDL